MSDTPSIAEKSAQIAAANEPAAEVEVETAEPTEEQQAAPQEDAEVDAEDTATSDRDDAPASDGKRKPGVHNRIDQLTREKYEAARRAEAAERQLAEMQEAIARSQQSRQQESQEKTLEDFNFDHDAYMQYREDRIAERTIQQFEQRQIEREQQRVAQEQRSAFESRVAAFEASNPGQWEQAITAPINYTEPMLQVVQSSENGPSIAAHLARNLDLADQISRMTPYAAAAALGRIEAEITAPKTPVVTPKPVTKTPAPPASLTGATPAKREWGQMSTEEHIAAFRAKQQARR